MSPQTKVKKKVLLVEDDQFLSKMYQKKFSVVGYEVEAAFDGLEGIEKMRTFKPDIVLMDIMMPKLNGIEALDRIMQNEDLKHTPIMILTNLSSADDAQTAVKKGAIKYIIKSDYTPSQIVSIAEKLIASKH